MSKWHNSSSLRAATNYCLLDLFFLQISHCKSSCFFSQYQGLRSSPWHTSTVPRYWCDSIELIRLYHVRVSRRRQSSSSAAGSGLWPGGRSHPLSHLQLILSISASGESPHLHPIALHRPRPRLQHSAILQSRSAGVQHFTFVWLLVCAPVAKPDFILATSQPCFLNHIASTTDSTTTKPCY